MEKCHAKLGFKKWDYQRLQISPKCSTLAHSLSLISTKTFTPSWYSWQEREMEQDKGHNRHGWQFGSHSHLIERERERVPPAGGELSNRWRVEADKLPLKTFLYWEFKCYKDHSVIFTMLTGFPPTHRLDHVPTMQTSIKDHVIPGLPTPARVSPSRYLYQSRHSDCL